MSLATRYRPASFEELVGQQAAVNILTKQLALPPKERSHAFLFYGQKGTGKTSAARIFGKVITDDANIVELDAASHNGVDDVRELATICETTSLFGGARVFILDEVHMFSKAAFNALLKTLEDTQEDVYFILCTTLKGKLPETVITRCLNVPFKWINAKTISVQLEKIVLEEGLHADAKALAAISTTSGGSLRAAIATLEAVVDKDNNIKYETVQNFLSIQPAEIVSETFSIVVTKDLPKLFSHLAALNKEGTLEPILLHQLYQYVRRLLLVKINGEHNIPAAILWKYEKEASLVTLDVLVSILEILGTYIDDEPVQDKLSFLETRLMKVMREL